MTIKYLNLNIWMGLMFEKTLAFIKEQDADIVVLQEVMDAKGENLSVQHKTKIILEKELGYKYSRYMPLALDKRLNPPAFFGNLTLSKFPIIESKEIFFDRPFIEWQEGMQNEEFPRGVLHTQISLPEAKVLNVFNIHGIWGKHGGVTDRRLGMIETLLKEIGDKENVMLSGDFNLNENVYPVFPDGGLDLSSPRRTKTVALLEEKLVNVFKDERITSFNPKQKDFPNTGYGTAVVDMAFVSPNIKVLSCAQPEADVSDHMPQIVDLQV